MHGLLIVGHTRQVLTVGVGGRSSDVHAMWLRDACVCERCRRPTSHERLLDATAISSEIAIITATNEPEGWLRVDASDGHRIWIGAAWLANHLMTSDLRHDPAQGRQLWDATTIGVGLTFDISGFEDPEERGPWPDHLYEHGVSWLGKNLAGEQGMRDVAALIGPIRSTHYGEIWTVDATIEPVTAVDSQRALRVHTDLPYFDNPPGVQLMQIESDGVNGGDPTFVDGYAVAEYLRATDPAAWRLLTTVDFAYPFVRDDIEMHGRAPLIGLARNGAYAQVRRAPRPRRDPIRRRRRCASAVSSSPGLDRTHRRRALRTKHGPRFQPGPRVGQPPPPPRPHGVQARITWPQSAARLLCRHRPSAQPTSACLEAPHHDVSRLCFRCWA